MTEAKQTQSGRFDEEELPSGGRAGAGLSSALAAMEGDMGPSGPPGCTPNPKGIPPAASRSGMGLFRPGPWFTPSTGLWVAGWP